MKLSKTQIKALEAVADSKGVCTLWPCGIKRATLNRLVLLNLITVVYPKPSIKGYVLTDEGRKALEEVRK